MAHVRVLSTPEKKRAFLKLTQTGVGRVAAANECGVTIQAVSYWRQQDAEFRLLDDRIKLTRQEIMPAARDTMPDFEEFSMKYLDSKLFNHHLQWVDLLEGREPRNLHPAQRHEVGSNPDFILINTPPEHLAAHSSPIYVDYKGWITLGEVEVGDYVFHRNGYSYEVADIYEGGERDLYAVEFGTGDVIETALSHEWQVRRSANHPRQLKTTESLMGDLRSPAGQLKWRVHQGLALRMDERELFDPYLLGYWIGDGSKSGAKFAVGDEDIDAFEEYVSKYETSKRRDSRGRSWEIYVKGIRKNLPLGDKMIPAGYFFASPAQRLELLRGLMDSDGTITEKDGRARFCQSERDDLCRDVYRLVASLGFQPRWKRYGKMNEISFKPDGDKKVFRLKRKADRQFTNEKNRRTEYKTIKSIRPVGRTEKVRCLTVLSDDNTYLIGDGLVETRG